MSEIMHFFPGKTVRNVLSWPLYDRETPTSSPTFIYHQGHHDHLLRLAMLLCLLVAAVIALMILQLRKINAESGKTPGGRQLLWEIYILLSQMSDGGIRLFGNL